MKRFGYEGFEIGFSEIGRRSASDRPFVLIHGLLLSHKHHRFLAEGLAERGNRLILIDLLGHGESNHPHDPRHYSMEQFARQVVALLDHLEISEAVVGGTSLGANTTLETAAHAPDRVRAMFIEMPVLEQAVPVAASIFAPLVMSLARFSTPWNAIASLMSRVPRGLHLYWDVMLDLGSSDPLGNAAVIHGLLSGRIAPHPDDREKLEHETLIIGHQRDLIHPFSDAEALHRELRNSDLVQARSIFELRFSPDRLTRLIGEWLDEVWLG